MNKTDLIKSILSKGQHFKDRKLSFGKYKTRTLNQVYKIDRRYLIYLLTEDFISERLRLDIEDGFMKAEGRVPSH